jgi:hypothetical protein
LVAAYGLLGSTGIVSSHGTGLSPYTLELAANITRRTPASRDASSTLSVPVVLTSL